MTAHLLEVRAVRDEVVDGLRLGDRKRELAADAVGDADLLAGEDSSQSGAGLSGPRGDFIAPPDDGLTRFGDSLGWRSLFHPCNYTTFPAR